MPTPTLIVGIGASSGGLEPLQALVQRLPAGRGLAVVVIQHLEAAASRNPTVDVLAGACPLRVVEAENGMAVEADTLYVTPPGRHLDVAGGHFTVREVAHCDRLRLPIDHFLCTLAAQQAYRCCGVLLSGGGSDGMLGLSEIKACGGLTIAQDPAQAQKPEMPQNALTAGVVDLTLKVAEMPAAILAYAEKVASQDLPEDDEAALRGILAALKTRSGHDFRCYKRGTLVRRIRRRAALTKSSGLAGYLQRLQTHDEEIAQLRKDLLIGVTDFFRQPEAWRVIEEKVIPSLLSAALADRSSEATAEARDSLLTTLDAATAAPDAARTLRIWVPGCATGKEAYTLAMLLVEAVKAAGAKIGIQIFATDTDESSLDIARAGIYPEAEVNNIPPARLHRFFTRKAGRCQVSKEIRDLVVFAQQNLTSDPPFSKLDLISCRNLLIYLDPAVQKKIVTLFHFALREGGYLFLGNAETVSGQEELFEPLSRKWRIYRRIGAGHRAAVELPLYAGREAGAAGRLPAPGGPAAWRQSLGYLIQQALLERFAPAAAIIDRRRQLLYSHGPVDRYLTVAPGESSLDFIEMAREGLRTRLRAAVTKAVETGRPVTFTARVKRGGTSVPVRVTLGPLRLPHETDGLLLATFEDVKLAAAAPAEPVAGDTSARQLEDELRVTREELQSTIEQLEGSNEELKASNEETTAANEELQSANEELETSKEELQSLNEELNTVNNRLQERADELEHSNNDLVNFQTSSNIGTVFLDRELRVRRYTPAVTALLSLIETDIGRPIGDVVRKFKDDALIPDAGRVLATLTPRSAEVLADNGLWFIRRITPYRTRDDRIEGVIVTFVDVNDLKEAQSQLECKVVEVAVAKDRLETVLASITDAYLVLDSDWRFVEINPVAEAQAFDRPASELLGKVIWDVFPQAVGGEVYQQYHAAVASGQPVHFEARSRILDKWWEIHAYPREGRLEVYMREITARKEAEGRLAYLASFPERNPNPIVEADLEGSVRYVNPAALRLFPDLGEQEAAHPWLADWAEAVRVLREEQADSAVRDIAVGDRVYQQSFYLFAEEGVVRIYGRDITERKQAEEALRQLNVELEQRVAEQTVEIRRQSAYHRSLIEASLDPLVTIGPDGKITDVNAATERVTGLARGELIGTDFSDYFTEPDQAKAGYEQVFREGLVRDYPLEVRHRDGHTVPVLYNATVYRDEAGQIIGVFAAARDITERKRAQARVEAERQRLYDVMETLPVYVVLLSTDYHVPFANKFFRERFGESHGRCCHDYLFQRTEPCENCETYKVLKTNAPHHWHWTGPDGRHYDIYDFPFTDADGSTMILEMGIDITEVKKAQAALQELNATLEQRVADRTAELAASEERFRLIIESAQDYAIFMLDPGGHVATWNTGAQRLKGYSAEEIIGKHFACFYPPEDPDKPQRELAIAAEAGQFSEEGWRLRKDGSRFWASVTITALHEPGGALRGFAKIARDITERKQAEEALRRSEARWNAAIENFGEGAIIATEAEQVTYWNPAARAMHGFASENEGLGPLQGTPNTFELWTPDGQHLLELDEWPMRRIKRGETVRHLELRLRRPDQGWEKIVSYSGAMVETASSERLIFLSVYDLTELRQAEAALRQTNEELTRFNRAAVDRELRMIELKKEVNALCAQGGQPVKYPLDFENETQEEAR